MKAQVIFALFLVALMNMGMALQANAQEHVSGLWYFKQTPEFIYGDNFFMESVDWESDDPESLIALTPSGEELVKSFTVQEVRFFTRKPSEKFIGKQICAGYYLIDFALIRRIDPQEIPAAYLDFRLMNDLYVEYVLELEFINGLKAITSKKQPAVMKRVDL